MPSPSAHQRFVKAGRKVALISQLASPDVALGSPLGGAPLTNEEMDAGIAGPEGAASRALDQLPDPAIIGRNIHSPVRQEASIEIRYGIISLDPTLRQLPQAQRLALAYSATIWVFPANERLFLSGKEARQTMFVISGRCDAYPGHDVVYKQLLPDCRFEVGPHDFCGGLPDTSFSMSDKLVFSVVTATPVLACMWDHENIADQLSTAEITELVRRSAAAAELRRAATSNGGFTGIQTLLDGASHDGTQLQDERVPLQLKEADLLILSTQNSSSLPAVGTGTPSLGNANRERLSTPVGSAFEQRPADPKGVLQDIPASLAGRYRVSDELEPEERPSKVGEEEGRGPSLKSGARHRSIQWSKQLYEQKLASQSSVPLRYKAQTRSEDPPGISISEGDDWPLKASKFPDIAVGEARLSPFMKMHSSAQKSDHAAAGQPSFATIKTPMSRGSTKHSITGSSGVAAPNGNRRPHSRPSTSSSFHKSNESDEDLGGIDVPINMCAAMASHPNDLYRIGQSMNWSSTLSPMSKISWPGDDDESPRSRSRTGKSEAMASTLSMSRTSQNRTGGHMSLSATTDSAGVAASPGGKKSEKRNGDEGLWAVGVTTVKTGAEKGQTIFTAKKKKSSEQDLDSDEDWDSQSVASSSGNAEDAAAGAQIDIAPKKQARAKSELDAVFGPPVLPRKLGAVALQRNIMDKQWSAHAISNDAATGSSSAKNKRKSANRDSPTKKAMNSAAPEPRGLAPPPQPVSIKPSKKSVEQKSSRPKKSTKENRQRKATKPNPEKKPIEEESLRQTPERIPMLLKYQDMCDGRGAKQSVPVSKLLNTKSAETMIPTAVDGSTLSLFEGYSSTFIRRSRAVASGATSGSKGGGASSLKWMRETFYTQLENSLRAIEQQKAPRQGTRATQRKRPISTPPDLSPRGKSQFD